MQDLLDAYRWSICKEMQAVLDKEKIIATPQYMEALFQIVLLQTQHLSLDLESFAKHGKRSTIGMEDVKLAARRNEALYSLLLEKAEQVKEMKRLKR